MEATLRYIYTSSYLDDAESNHDWRFHLEIAVAAKKYLIPALEREASSDLDFLVYHTRDTSAILSIVLGMYEFKEQHEKSAEVVD